MAKWVAGGGGGGGGASLAGDNVFAGKQQINGPVGVNVVPSVRQPFNTIMQIDAAAPGTNDKIGHCLITQGTGNYGTSTGSNGHFLWGLNVFTSTGVAAGDAAGANIQNLIETSIAAASGTIPVAQGLVTDVAFFGAAAGATVTQMESLRVAAPRRKDGATAGTATTVYGAFIENVVAANTGATNAFSLFVEGGLSRFQGPMQVAGTINNTTNTLDIRSAYSNSDGAVLSLASNAADGGAGFTISKSGSYAFIYDSAQNRPISLFWRDVSSTETALSLLYHNGTVAKTEKVTVGAADSGGSGYRTLRVPN